MQTKDIMGLATFTFNTSTYFQYNGNFYKWLDGTALASQVSVVFIVARTLIQNIQERATIFLVPHVTLPSGKRQSIRFHALVSTITITHRKQLHTNRLLHKSSASVLPDLIRYKITATCNSVTTHILLTLPYGA